jgi:hypothetical protein
LSSDEGFDEYFAGFEELLFPDGIIVTLEVWPKFFLNGILLKLKNTTRHPVDCQTYLEIFCPTEKI